MAVIPSAWVKQRQVKKEMILRHLSSRSDKTESYHNLRSICQGELLSDFIIFREAVEELEREGKVERIIPNRPLAMVCEMVRLK